MLHIPRKSFTELPSEILESLILPDFTLITLM